MRALEKQKLWTPDTRLDSWMFRIMRNIWVDELRARQRRSQTFVHEEEGAAVASRGSQEDAAMIEDIDRALRVLPGEQREAVLLVMVEGYSYREAAEIAGCPVGTMNSRLVRGRTALLKHLGDNDDTE